MELETTPNTSFLDQIEIHAIDVITNQFSEKLVYHNIQRVKRVIDAVKIIGKAEKLTDEEMDICLATGWLFYLGFSDDKNFENVKEAIDLYHNCIRSSIHKTETYLDKIKLDKDKKAQIMGILKNLNPEAPNKSKLSNVLHDAFAHEWTQPKAKKNLKLLYKELLLISNLNEGRKNWTETILDYVNSFYYYTEYGQKYLAPKKDKLALKLTQEIKSLKKAENFAIQKQLGISDEEIKSLSKKLRSVTGRDERGIQTMFRTTIKNHYTLNEMVDRKSNIMISVNAIIISLLVTRLLSDIDTFCIHTTPILLMLICATISIVFAIIAIRPAREHGKFSEEDIREKRGNLLYFGNYYKMSLREYYWGMMQMLNDSEYLYASMVRDQYFLGQKLGNKYRLIRLSLNVFMIGTVISLILFLIVSSMSDFHLGNPTH